MLNREAATLFSALLGGVVVTAYLSIQLGGPDFMELVKFTTSVVEAAGSIVAAGFSNLSP
jgi:hypothetical protein